MSDDTQNHDDHSGSRRDFLYLSAGAFAGVGGAIALWPFVDSMNPSADVLALSSVEVDVSQVEVGQRIKLDFGTVDVGVFESSRTQYHRQLQDTFFRNNTITGVQEYVVRNGESVWILALRQYDVPVWLFRQYNPELDLHNVRVGTRLNFPILVKNEKR